MQTVKIEYERHQKEHKVIDQFQGNVEKCREAEVNTDIKATISTLLWIINSVLRR